MENKFSLSGTQYLAYWTQCDYVGLWNAQIDWIKIKELSQDRANNRQAAKFGALVVAKQAEDARRGQTTGPQATTTTNRLGIIFG